MKSGSFHRVKNMVAVTLVVATTLLSCKDDIPLSDIASTDELPTQKIDNMTDNQAPHDVFPSGIVMRGYTPQGLLETRIRANYAKHVKKPDEEIWEAHGNVVINNYINGERIETDTLFWNRLSKRIYTHSWVKITTVDLFMQGYGMESDEMARNAVIQNPFDSYAIVRRDSTEIPYIDTANFIGPLLPQLK
jgi:hypothetical protein